MKEERISGNLEEKRISGHLKEEHISDHLKKEQISGYLNEERISDHLKVYVSRLADVNGQKRNCFLPHVWMNRALCSCDVRRSPDHMRM